MKSNGVRKSTKKLKWNKASDTYFWVAVPYDKLVSFYGSVNLEDNHHSCEFEIILGDVGHTIFHDYGFGKYSEKQGKKWVEFTLEEFKKNLNKQEGWVWKQLLDIQKELNNWITKKLND